MLDEKFILVGALLSLIGGLNYLVGTVKGKTRPNKVTWLLWTLAPMIAFTAQVKQGVGLQSLLTFMVGFNPLLIFIASFVNKKASWNITRFDLLCATLSVLGLVLWYITKVGNVAIFFSIVADVSAGLPTIVKAFNAPETESYLVFLLGGINALITLATIDVWNFQYFAFPVYIVGINTILIILIKFKIGKHFKLRMTKT